MSVRAMIEEVRVAARVDGGADALDRGVLVDDRLAVEVAAALRVDLVLDVACRRGRRPRASWIVRATFIGSPKPVSASMIAGSSVIRAICCPRPATSVSVVSPMSGSPRSAREHRARDVDALEALLAR